MEIKTNNDMRSAVTLLNNSLLAMCNATTIEDVVAQFTQSKDFLVELYKFNVERLIQKKDKNS